MVEIKFWIVPVAGLIPLIIGFIWYNPKVLGTAWMNAAGLTEEKLKGANMGLIFFLTYIFSSLLASSLLSITIHQLGFQSTLMNEEGFGKEGSEIMIYISYFISKYGANFRTFKHGALHGTIAGIFLALPIVAVNALFERKSWKYIWINAGFWILSMMLMGGVVCQFA